MIIAVFVFSCVESLFSREIEKKVIFFFFKRKSRCLKKCDWLSLILLLSFNSTEKITIAVRRLRCSIYLYQIGSIYLYSIVYRH